MRDAMTEETWKFEGLELDRRSFSLRREGVLLRLDRKPLELLFMLVESRGAVISHEAALERVWGSDVFVNGEAAIYTAIKKIRQATGDASLIETVPGKGYRLRTRSSRALSPHGRRIATDDGAGTTAGNFAAGKSLQRS